MNSIVAVPFSTSRPSRRLDLLPAHARSIIGPLWRLVAWLAVIAPAASFAASSDEPSLQDRLGGFDQFMEQVLKDWNAPGVSVGVVVKDKLVLAKGYGYRDIEKKLPMTPRTLFQVASNSKLFTAIGAGMLVDAGQLEWDKPVRTFVPAIQFFNDDLNRSITLRDMLAHRTGITRHDSVWYKSDFARKDLFEKLKHLEPSAAPRQRFLYNNLMYSAVGHIIHLLSGQTWEEFTRERIFKPLDMNASVFTVAEMRASPDHAVPYRERRDSTELFQTPFYEEQDGIAPAGAIISNVEDMSHWLIALMNNGRFRGRDVLPQSALRATLAPAMPDANADLDNHGYRELLNPIYGMGRYTAVYRGHAITYHGGSIGGFYSQVSFMPHDYIGVIVLVDGGHCRPLPNLISYWIYERWLGLNPTPWSDRRNTMRLKLKKSNLEARTLAGGSRVRGTRPSHALAEFAGEFEHPAYGVITTSIHEGKLQLFRFKSIALPLEHYHYNRFDTPDDEVLGKFSLNFLTNPLGEVDKAVISLDQSEVMFRRRPDAVMRDPRALARLEGTYESGAGVKFQIVAKGGNLAQVSASGDETLLEPVRPWIYRPPKLSDVRYEFMVESDTVKALKVTTATGEYMNVRQ